MMLYKKTINKNQSKMKKLIKYLKSKFFPARLFMRKGYSCYSLIERPN